MKRPSKDVREIIENNGNNLLFSVPYRPKTNAIESWFSQFKHYFQLSDTGIEYKELTRSVRKTIRKISNTSYLNYMKYAYQNKENRKYIAKKSTKRKPSKNYSN